MEQYLNAVKVVVIVAMTWMFGEFGSYFHHRWGSHNHKLRVNRTHSLHHMTWNYNKEHKAYEDFIWVAAALAIIGVSMCILNYFINCPLVLGTSFSTMCIFSLYKAYIHAAYHTPKNMLNEYKFFREWKRLHDVHHRRPTKNYSISWFYPDKLFGTFVEA